MPRHRLFVEWLATLAFALLCCWWAMGNGLTARFDNALLDRLAVRVASAPSENIIIAAIDDRSLRAEGQWPWNRRRVADLVDILSDAGAKAVVLDVLYVEPSDPAADEALADAIRRSGRVALPYTFTNPSNRSSGADRLAILPALESGAFTTGQVAVEPDTDGLIRRFPLQYSDGAREWPHLQAALYERLGGPAINWSDAAIPLRPSGSYRTVPASAVLSGEIPRAMLSGKLVFVGATAPGLRDTFPVSAAAGLTMSGVELQANLFQAITEHQHIVAYPFASRFALGAIAITLVFLGFWRLRPLLGLLVAIGMIGLVVVLSAALLELRLAWFAPGPAVLALAIAYPLWGWRRLTTVSAFLRTKVASLSDRSGEQATREGFDQVARQASRLSFLVDRLDERQRFLQRVLESSPEAMCAFGPDGGLALANQQAHQLFGTAIAGQQMQDIVLSSGALLSPDKKELTFPDGRSYAISQSRRGENGSLEGLQVVTFADISEIRRAEAERREMLEFLSHDMRSPQVAILGLTQPGQAGEDAQTRLDRIEKHARRTLSLADNFVQISRLAEIPLDFEEVDLVSIATEAIDRVWHLARQRKIKVNLATDLDAAFLVADGQVLSRAVDNLLGNAVRYCPEGSAVEIGIEERSKRKWRLTIADNGSGLPEARRAAPFARFGMRSSRGGSGLGLAFVETAILKHHGTIACRTSDEGTRFQIDLPKAQVKAA